MAGERQTEERDEMPVIERIREHVGIARRAVWLGPVEVEWRRGLSGHVRFDPGGITHYKGGHGGVFTLRLTDDAGVEVVAWSRLLYRFGMALNEAAWRREDRRAR